MKIRKKRSNILDKIIQQNKSVILNGIIGQQNELQLESSICFARYLSSVGLNRKTYRLFLQILETNNRWIVDALIGKTKPSLLFTPIRPNKFLIRRAFQLLSFWHPGEIYSKVLLAILGIIQYSYYSPDDGYKMVRLEINNLNSIGKFLLEDRDQDDPINREILHILDKITKLGEYHNDLQKSVIAKHAFNLRIAFFDNKKKLLNVIPGVILVKLKRKQDDLKPSKKFLKFLNKDENQ